MLLGLLGGGGSILTVPVLMYFFGFGMKEAVPMSLVVVGLTSLYGVTRHHRAGNVSFRAALAFGPLAIVGSFGGAALALRASGTLQVTVFAVVMLLASLAMLFGRRIFGLAEQGDGEQQRHPAVMAGLGGAVGLLTGFVGVGGGFLYVPALTTFGGVLMRRAVGTSLVLIALSCAAGLARYLGAVSLEWGLIAVFTGLAFVGVVIGSALAQRASHAVLRQGFALFLLAMSLVVFWRGEG